MRFRCLWALSGLIAAGCSPGEDSWRHYTGGGDYVARTPSMSPDGSVIVFSSPRSGHGDIYQIKTDGSERIRLTTAPAFEADPIFSPNGDTIAFSREEHGSRHIWLMDADGSNQRQFTFGKTLDDPQSFSPDGSELLIWRSLPSIGMGRSTECFAINVRSNETRRLDGY